MNDMGDYRRAQQQYDNQSEEDYDYDYHFISKYFPDDYSPEDTADD